MMVETPKDVQDINKNPEDDSQPSGNAGEVQKQLSVEELQEKIKTLEEKANSVPGLIEQIKELRKQKQEAEAQAMAPKEPEPKKGDDVEAKVFSILQKEREEEAKENRLTALHKFWETHPEYNPENDISGLRMESVNQTLKRLNTSKSRRVEEILKDYEDALKLMGKTETEKNESNLNQFASTPGGEGSPKVAEDKRLTSEQEKLRKEKGWTVEKYLKMKERHPKIVL